MNPNFNVNDIWEAVQDYHLEIKTKYNYQPKNNDEEVERVKKINDEIEEMYYKIQLKNQYFEKNYPVVLHWMIFFQMFKINAFNKFLEKEVIVKDDIAKGKYTKNEISAWYIKYLYKEIIPSNNSNKKKIVDNMYQQVVTWLDQKDADIKLLTKQEHDRFRVMKQEVLKLQKQEIVECISQETITKEQQEELIKLIQNDKEANLIWKKSYDELVEWYEKNKRAPDNKKQEEKPFVDWILKQKEDYDNKLLSKFRLGKLENFELWKEFLKVIDEMDENEMKMVEQRKKKKEEERRKK
jgi:hypothetical protein